MPSSVGGVGDPYWALNSLAAESAIATYLKAQGITTQAQLVTFINGLTDAQTAALVRALLKNWIQQNTP